MVEFVPERTMDECADVGPNSPRSPRAMAWDTRRARYGDAGHAGYRSKPRRLRTPLETAAMRLIARLHAEGVLSEGQCCQALALDRLEFRQIVDGFKGGATVGEQIWLARDAAGLTQEELAKAIGVGRPQIANMEAGRCEVTAGRLMAIAAALGVSPGDLFPVAARATGPASPLGDSGKASK